jgi:hypothetical protein
MVRMAPLLAYGMSSRRCSSHASSSRSSNRTPAPASSSMSVSVPLSDCSNSIAVCASDRRLSMRLACSSCDFRSLITCAGGPQQCVHASNTGGRHGMRACSTFCASADFSQKSAAVDLCSKSAASGGGVTRRAAATMGALFVPCSLAFFAGKSMTCASNNTADDSGLPPRAAEPPDATLTCCTRLARPARTSSRRLSTPVVCASESDGVAAYVRLVCRLESGPAAAFQPACC